MSLVAPINTLGLSSLCLSVSASSLTLCSLLTPWLLVALLFPRLDSDFSWHTPLLDWAFVALLSLWLDFEFGWHSTLLHV